ncbi:hypothetical protein MRX96_013309 [Rhipicephalus microplus]
MTLTASGGVAIVAGWFEKSACGIVSFENIGLELRENRPGRLSLYTFARCDPSMNDYGSVCVTLLAELLATHRCIYFVHFGYARKPFSMKMSVIQHLTPNSSIEQFHVDGQAMDSDEMYTFIRAMRRAKPLSVQVCNMLLRRCDVHSISTYVEVTSTLRELALVDTGFKVADTILLFKALEKSKSVEYLRLQVNTSKVKLQANGAVAIAAALAENTTLVSLHIASNSIGPVGARALAETLKTNSSLAVLDLRDNSIGTSGAVAFATALKVNSKLEELHVCRKCDIRGRHRCHCGGSHGQQVAQGAVAVRQHIRRGRKPLDAFAEALAANTAIRQVRLFVWGTHAMKQLSHMLLLTQTLQSLCVCTCGPEIEQLCAALAQNKSIQEVEINCYLNMDDCYLNLDEGTALAHLFETTTTIQVMTITKRVKNTCLIRLFNGIRQEQQHLVVQRARRQPDVDCLHGHRCRLGE